LRRPITYRTHRDLARAVSSVENGILPVDRALQTLRTNVGANGTPPKRMPIVGVTGPPGAGKSTLVDQLIARFRAGGDTVGIIAVDPSSPFTHGAVLGDRVRMQQHSGDSGVYIRSMASRQAGGGLAPTTRDALRLVEAAGFDLAIVETVGVGQVELEVVGVADIVVVVTVPGLGDGVQTIKAGLTEIADIFVVNMADRPGANQTALELTHMVREGSREIHVLKTVGTDGTGVDELAGAIRSTINTQKDNAARSVRFEVVRQARDRAVAAAQAALDSAEAAAVLDEVRAHRLSRTSAISSLLAIVTGAQHAD
jgi:LAO/AO transport system kinase